MIWYVLYTIHRPHVWVHFDSFFLRPCFFWDALQIKLLQAVVAAQISSRRGWQFFRNPAGVKSSSSWGIYIYMGVSKNNGTPKSSILIGFSIINRPFWGTPIFGNTHIYIYIYPGNLPSLKLTATRGFSFRWSLGVFSPPGRCELFVLGSVAFWHNNGGGWFRWFSGLQVVQVILNGEPFAVKSSCFWGKLASKLWRDASFKSAEGFLV